MRHLKLFEAFNGPRNGPSAEECAKMSDQELKDLIDPKINKGGIPMTAVREYERRFPPKKKTAAEKRYERELFGEFRADESFVNESDKGHYSHVKDLDVPRPRYVPTPKPSGSMMASEGQKYFDLYLQDQASDVFIDKYGYDRGIQTWEYSMEGSRGAMFAMSAKVCNEKLQMLKDLEILQDYGRDYFKRSYFDLWKEWKAAGAGAKSKQAA